nr:MAG TPA: hypothetical protein [Caudoviricetes sp.]
MKCIWWRFIIFIISLIFITLSLEFSPQEKSDNRKNQVIVTCKSDKI